jgi:hypothetical protein
VREEAKEEGNAINLSFDYSMNEPLIQDEDEIGSDRPHSGDFMQFNNQGTYNLLE